MKIVSAIHWTGLWAIYLATVVSAADVVVVKPSSPGGWQTSTASATASVEFVAGPATPPQGAGGAEFRVTGNGEAELRYGGLHDVALESLRGLSYWTAVEAVPDNGARKTALVLHVRYLATDETDRLFFEPRHQTDVFVPVNGWQLWDAQFGLWWSENEAAVSGLTLRSFDDFRNDPRQGRIVNGPNGAGGLRFSAGFPEAGNWGDFVGNVDALQLSADGLTDTTFDFEPDATPPPDTDGDGILDGDDHCPNSDIALFVDVNGAEPGETSIDNTVDEHGCTLQDHVNALAAQSKNHGAYVSGISHMANELRKAGLITKVQSGEMKKGAQKSSIGKK